MECFPSVTPAVFYALTVPEYRLLKGRVNARKQQIAELENAAHG